MGAIVICAYIIAGAGYQCANPPPDKPPVLMTYYNPLLCYEGLTINCDGDPMHLALVPFDPLNHYGRVAACPPGWTTYGYTSVVVIEGVGERWCLDSGSGVRLRLLNLGGGLQWVYIVDSLEDHEPPWNGWVIKDWHIKKRPLAERP